jgi:hypothetical protein
MYMMKQTGTLGKRLPNFFSFLTLMVLVFGFAACNDDPTPVNEEEVITTLTVSLTPAGGGVPVTLRFSDPDGSGSSAPTKTVSGPLSAGKTYTAIITLQNESGASPIDITAEVRAEATDHLICFTTTGTSLTITAADTDDNGMAIGLTSTWTTASPGNSNVKITLRHQPGTKTGTCPGAGETDAEVDFDVTVQ